FTPAWIAEFLVDETLSRLVDSQGPGSPPARFLDPACGSGHILVPALRRLVAEGCRTGVAPPAVSLSAVLQDKLFGCDIDPLMIELSGLSIYLASREIAPSGELPAPQLFHFGLGTTEESAAAAIGSLWLASGVSPETIRVFGPDGPLPLDRSPLAGS